MSIKLRDDRSFLFNNVDNFLLFNKSTTFVNGKYDKIYLQEMCNNFSEVLSFSRIDGEPNIEENLEIFLNSGYYWSLESGNLASICYRNGFEWMHCTLNCSNNYTCKYSDLLSWLGFFLAISHWYSCLSMRELLSKVSLSELKDLYPSMKDYCIEEVFRFVDYRVLGKEVSRWDGYCKQDDFILHMLLRSECYSDINYLLDACSISGKLFYRVAKCGFDIESFYSENKFIELLHNFKKKKDFMLSELETTDFLNSVFDDLDFSEDDEFEVDFESREYWCGFVLVLMMYVDSNLELKEFMFKYSPNKLFKLYNSFKNKPLYYLKSISHFI